MITSFWRRPTAADPFAVIRELARVRMYLGISTKIVFPFFSPAFFPTWSCTYRIRKKKNFQLPQVGIAIV